MLPVVTDPVTALQLASPPRPVARLLRAAMRSVGGLARAIAHRRDVMHMLELDDRALKDIGLVRGDVLGALEASLGRDPSVLLRLRTVERRARRGRAPAAARSVSPADCDA